jgi:hypothetical protein
MKVSRMIPAFVVSFALGVTAYPAMAKQDHRSKVKSTETKATKDNSGREAGALPSGLQKYSERKGELPSGLQKNKDDGELTKGLQDGGKKVKTTKTK